MKVVVGSIIKKDNKILMIKEAKKEAYGKWSFPAGHLEENESIEEGALREVLEETGCKVELKSLLPIRFDMKNEIIQIYFLSKPIEEGKIIDTDEILEKRWLAIEEITKMKSEEFRYPRMLKERLKDLENKEEYPLSFIKNMKKE